MERRGRQGTVGAELIGLGHERRESLDCQRMKNGLAAAERAEWSWLDELETNTKNEM